jgi:hypothetical protein
MSSTTSSGNVGVGYKTLLSTTTGASNVAIGQQALSANTTASSNTAVGYQAGYSNTASSGTFVGFNAGQFATSAAYSTFMGFSAGQGITGAKLTGNYNAAFGYQAGLKLQGGANSNTLIGGSAGNEITTGAENTFVGYSTGTYQSSTITGQGNVLIGAYCDTTATGQAYAMGLGYNLDCDAGYTTLGNGNSDIRAAHGNVTWATVSDERYKKDIVDSTAGLSFINALQPRTFKYKTLGELPETFRAYEADSTEVFKNSNTNHGFIAQEVKVAIDNHPELKDGFKLWDDRSDGSQEVAEAALIPILVKAIQELTARIEILEG